MKIALTADQSHINGELTASLSECPFLILIDSQTMHYESLANPYSSGTIVDEISSAQLVASKAVGAVMTGKVGLNAARMLSLEGIKVVTGISGNIRDAVMTHRSDLQEAF